MAQQKNIDNAIFLKEQHKLLWSVLSPDLDDETPALKAAEQLVKSYPEIVRNRLELLDLILTALEAGTAFLKGFGDIWEDYYDTMDVFWQMLEKNLESNDLPRFSERLIDIQKNSQLIDGYGYCDHVDDMLDILGITVNDED